MNTAPTIAQLPADARRHLHSGDHELIYNPYSTTTWRVRRSGGAVVFLKAAPAGMYPSLAAERDRCLWLSHRGVVVPQVVDYGLSDRIEWLLTVAVPGTPATAAQHLSRPQRTVPLLAEGLRAFHEVDPTGCPFDHRVPAMLRHVAKRVASGQAKPHDLHQEFRHLSPAQALEQLRVTVPTDEDLVVCHGDYCFPNVLLQDGAVTGYLDLGEAGFADRWCDLAVATWSVTWNVGPGYEDLFLDAYGTVWDLDRRDFYRLLYDLES